MKRIKMMKKYASLIATIGINAGPQQNIVIEASVEMSEFVRYLVMELYNQKVKDVDVIYYDSVLTKQKMLHTPIKKLSQVDEFYISRMQKRVNDGYARIFLDGDDPSVYASVASEKINAYSNAKRKATYNFRKAYNSNELAWCIAGVPTKKWAKRVFPDDTPTQAMNKLWQAIYQSCRVEEDNDPQAEWKKHIETLTSNAKKINDMKLKKLHYTNSLGTDLWVELPENYLFCGAHSVQSRFKTMFTPNLPTEEIFASPHKDGINGIVFASKVLSHNGELIDKFWLKFEKGKVVDFGAEVGYEALRNIIEFDEGSCRLGECALIPYHSPISQMGIIFFNTLFDENASCHLALGASFSECLVNGENMTEEELSQAGLNNSKEHVDFMIGTKDLSIVGEDSEGHKYPIFVDGDFAI